MQFNYCFRARQSSGLLASGCAKVTVLGLLSSLIVLSCVPIQPVEGTFFILGEVCVIGLNGVILTVSEQLDQLGIRDAVDVVQCACRFISFYSLPGILGRRLQPAVTELVELIGTGLQIPQLPEFAERVTNLANQVTRAGGPCAV